LPPEAYETTLSFQELWNWLEARLGQSLSIQIVAGRESVAFLDGPIDNVMGFRAGSSHGFFVEGGAGAWTFHLPEPEFLTAAIWPIPGIPEELGHKQVLVRMRGHMLMINPGTEDEALDEDE
jgi:hypothetical protein